MRISSLSIPYIQLKKSLSNTKTRWDQSLFGEGEKAELKKSVVKKVAKDAFQELAITMAISTATSFFIPTPFSIGVAYAVGVSIWVFNTAVRVARAYLFYRLETSKEETDPKKVKDRELWETCYKATGWICPMTFGIYYHNTAGVLVHEAGHAITATALLQNPNPTVTVRPFDGGVTRYTIQGLTGLGKVFGEKTSRFLIAGAGAGASIISSVGMIITAHYVRKKNPELYRYLIAMAVTSLASEVFYAFTTFLQSYHTNGHDFLRLWTGGIHPALAIGTMVAIPILVKGGLCLSSFAHQSLQKRKAQLLH